MRVSRAALVLLLAGCGAALPHDALPDSAMPEEEYEPSSSESERFSAGELIASTEAPMEVEAVLAHLAIDGYAFTPSRRREGPSRWHHLEVWRVEGEARHRLDHDETEDIVRRLSGLLREAGAPIRVSLNERTHPE